MRGGLHLPRVFQLFLISGLWLLNARFLALTGGDGWWLACYAREWLQTGRIPREVLGSFALSAYAYHHPDWLYGQWTFLWLSLGGPRLWVWMDALVAGGLAALALWRLFVREGLDPWVRAVLIGWVGALSWAGQTQRGQIWAIALFFWLLVWLRDALEETPPRSTLWRLPLIIFLWAGFQGGFLLPLGMITLALMLRPSRMLAGALGLSFVATLLHPYAPQNWVDHVLILRHPPTFIWEWQSLPAIVQNLSHTYGEPLLLMALVASLPFVLSLAPLVIPAPLTRWDLFLSLLVVGFGIGGIRHVRQVVWALNAAAALAGHRLARREFRIPRFLVVIHLVLALVGWGVHLPALLRTGYTGMEETETFLWTLQSLPPARVFATLKVANTLCWLNPRLSQWMYGTFQFGIARNDREWEEITRNVIQPFREVPQGGSRALAFLVHHRVDYALLHRTRDMGLVETLRQGGCEEAMRGRAFSLFALRDCLWQTPGESPPQAEDPAP